MDASIGPWDETFAYDALVSPLKSGNRTRSGKPVKTTLSVALSVVPGGASGILLVQVDLNIFDEQQLSVGSLPLPYVMGSCDIRLDGASTR